MCTYILCIFRFLILSYQLDPIYNLSDTDLKVNDSSIFRYKVSLDTHT